LFSGFGSFVSAWLPVWFLLGESVELIQRESFQLAGESIWHESLFAIASAFAASAGLDESEQVGLQYSQRAANPSTNEPPRCIGVQFKPVGGLRNS
jgi:hypothetical protein